MNGQDRDSRIHPSLWILMAFAASIVLILLSAVLLRSLLLSIFFAFLLAIIALVIWQRERVVSFAGWLLTHPNTTLALRWCGIAATRVVTVGIPILVTTIVGIGKALFWLAVLPVRASKLLRVRRHRPSVTNEAKRPREQRTTSDEANLERWKNAETRDVKQPRDPRSKFCLSKIGNEIQIVYRGKIRTIRPLRVFTKPDYQKTYVEAVESGEVKTFNIDDVQLA